MKKADLHNEIVNYILDLYDFEQERADKDGYRFNAAATYETICRALAERFPTASNSDVSRALDDVSDRLTEDSALRKDQMRREQVFYGKILELFDGLPENTPLLEAVRLRKEQGIAFAFELEASGYLDGHLTLSDR